MAQEFYGRVQHKRDTSANWTAANPVIRDGELIIVDTASGEVRTKIGDGVKTYTQLPFEDEVVRGLVNSKANLVNGTVPVAELPTNLVAYNNEEIAEPIPGYGPMLASVYDPQGKEQDIFAYVDQQMGVVANGSY